MKNLHRKFTEKDQTDFARLSGDDNPVHCDPVFARRTVFGEPIVHGMHVALWAIETFLLTQSEFNPRFVAATFVLPVRLNHEVVLSVVSERADCADFELKCDGETVVEVSLRGQTGVRHTRGRYDVVTGSTQEIAVREWHHFERGEKGDVALTADTTGMEDVFPSIFGAVGAANLSSLLAVSRLVGGICPGLHSVMSSFDLELGNGDRACNLDYELVRLDKRFSMLTMKLNGAVSGEVCAFFRPPPVAQISAQEASKHVEPGEFAGSRPLIVGGSRGLGEVFAKVLAAGGADVALTYKTGLGDAQRVCREIEAAGGTARILKLDLDTLDLALEKLRSDGFRPTDIYFCATPKIFEVGLTSFSHERFKSFCDIYVSAFAELCRAVMTDHEGILKVYYPSSEAVDQPGAGLAEYAAAKAAGEQICEYLSSGYPGLHIEIDRLPRLETDQTTTIGRRYPAESPLPHAIDIARRMGSQNAGLIDGSTIN